MRQFKLDKIKATGTTVGDVHFPKTELLLPFGGTNGATSTDDLSNRNNAVTFGGNASISTVRSKFGSSSCHFDGSGDYIDVGGSSLRAACDSGDFALEFWLNIDALTGNDAQSLISNYGTNTAGWYMYFNNSSPYQVYLYHHNGSSWVGLNHTGGTRTSLSLDTWYHIAWTRSGNDFRLFLNGTQEDSVTDSNNIAASNGGVFSGLRLGAVNAGLNYPVNGYIDDVRITSGAARYTSNFTAPTTAHPTSAGDVNKHIVVNSDADGVAIGTGGINQARIAKAWCNWDQTGTIAIRSSYNISSITDTATGRTDVNFSTAMTDTNYSAVGYGNHKDAVSAAGNFSEYQALGLHLRTANDIEVACYKAGVGYIDSKQADVIIFGN